MRKKWTIALITTFAIVGAYYVVWAVAKNTYENQIDDKIDGVCCNRFYEAITVSYPFLWQSATAIRSKAGAIKYIASEAGYDRYVFSVLWKQYEKSPECIHDSRVLFDLDFFTSSNNYSSLIYAGKSLEKQSATIGELALAGKLIRNTFEIVEMDSILTVTKRADSYALDFFSDLSPYKDFSHDINDWRSFDTREYSIEIDRYIQLKKEPFSLYNYLFNNPLNKK